MFRVFPQDLKTGDIISHDEKDSLVIWAKEAGESIDVKVLTETGTYEVLGFSKSEMLDINPSDEIKQLFEPTIPDLPYNLDEATTHPLRKSFATAI